MSQLAKLQQNFQDCVLKQSDSKAPVWVSAVGRARPEVQLSVYSHAYRARLKEVLASDYTAVHMAIGEDAFDKLAETYIQDCPSKYFSLRDFGGGLPEFINRHPQYQQIPWLHELAEFEWLLCAAFDAADAPRLTDLMLATVTAEQWPQLCFVAHPSVRRIDFQWNIPPMWKVLTADTPTEIHAQAADDSYWLIWRDDLVTRFRSLDDEESSALDVVLRGGNFAELCAVLANYQDHSQVPLRAATLLKNWLGQGLFINA